MRENINIAIAEDHDLFRQGMVSLLKKYKHINVVLEVNDGKKLLAGLKSKHPDIILLDLDMPVVNGKVVLETVRKKFKDIKIIVITAFFQKEYVVDYIQASARAFLPKVISIDKLVKAIEQVYKNGTYFTRDILKILEESKNKTQEKSILTDKEIEIARLVCKGITTKEISKIFMLTTHAINFHRSNILRKTGATSVASLYSYCVKNKIISLSEKKLR